MKYVATGGKKNRQLRILYPEKKNTLQKLWQHQTFRTSKPEITYSQQNCTMRHVKSSKVKEIDIT